MSSPLAGWLYFARTDRGATARATGFVSTCFAGFLAALLQVLSMAASELLTTVRAIFRDLYTNTEIRTPSGDKKVKNAAYLRMRRI